MDASVPPKRLRAENSGRTAATHLAAAAAGRSSGLVIQALRSLGPEHIGADRIARLRRTLPADERRALLDDLALAPTWMRPLLRELAEMTNCNH